MLVWGFRTRQGRHVAAVVWCACGAVTYPGLGGRWIAKNIRRSCVGMSFPAWHRSLIDLDRPAKAYERLSETTSEITGVSDVDAMAGGWRRVDRCRVAAGRELVRPASVDDKHPLQQRRRGTPWQRRIA
jgi:hypothetical protein